MNEFLPVSRADMDARGIDQLDFICITGDSYVDHPSFGVSIISRVVEDQGFTVGVIAQPDWKTRRDFEKLGRPKCAFLVTSGNIDSMVAHYTVAKNRRSVDAYTAGGVMGRRPDRAVTVYCRKLREIYGDIPIVIGGLEASLRRFAHYDYWDDSVHPSILEESGADLLSYGMGELQTGEIVRRLGAGEDIRTLTDIRGTCYLCAPADTPFGGVQCPDYKIICTDKKAYCKATKIQMDQQDEVYGRMILQRQKEKMLVQNPPMRVLTTEELDHVYALPYTRRWHPMYDAEGGVPGLAEVEFSIAHNRGCFGNCNFCSIAFHQGRKIAVRSQESVLAEAKLLTTLPGFKGYIHDVGGPTANFRHPSCKKQQEKGLCMGRKCLAPTPCPALDADERDYLELLRKVRELPGVKRVFIRSGIRYDYMMEDPDDTFFKELVQYHVSGQLKVAPEHCSSDVLDAMGKPHIDVYKAFAEKFYRITKKLGKKQFLVPYLMSSHPGSTLKDAVELALFLKEQHIHPEQVQDCYPTPGTVSTCMFFTEMNPYTLEPVFVPKTPEEKAMQRALLQYFLSHNRGLVVKALRKAGRADLIGSGPECLVPAPVGEVASGQRNGKGSVHGSRGDRPGTADSRKGRNSVVQNGAKPVQKGASKVPYGSRKGNVPARNSGGKKRG